MKRRSLGSINTIRSTMNGPLRIAVNRSHSPATSSHPTMVDIGWHSKCLRNRRNLHRFKQYIGTLIGMDPLILYRNLRVCRTQFVQRRQGQLATGP